MSVGNSELSLRKPMDDDDFDTFDEKQFDDSDDDTGHQSMATNQDDEEDELDLFMKGIEARILSI